jgi:hypothetical protein
MASAKAREEQTATATVLDPDFADDVAEIIKRREVWKPQCGISFPIGARDLCRLCRGAVGISLISGFAQIAWGLKLTIELGQFAHRPGRQLLQALE